MQAFNVKYKSYSSTKEEVVIAPNITRALEKGEKIVKKEYATRVLSVQELIESVELA